MPKATISSSSKVLILGLLISLLPWLNTGIFTYLFLEHEAFFQQKQFFFILFSGLVWGLLCALALGNPTYLSAAYGYLIGPAAMLLMIICNAVAIILIYYFFQQFRPLFLENALNENPRARNLISNIKKKELSVIIYTKLSPIFPFALTNVCFAASGASFKNILLGGFIGMIPRTALAIFTGMQAANLQGIIKGERSPGYEDAFLVGLLLISILGLYFTTKSNK
jgi:uncharacterized membrane protein YdjX (TVP38/TMEM64 family)